MTSFPEGWFFIKNQSTGYLLSTEKAVIGEPVVISSLKNRDYEPQLWRHGEDGRLYNKKTNFVLDIAKGNIKAGTEIVQQHSNDQSNTQNFKISSEGHIYVPENPNLVLGIKESFFARKEGLRVHLQLTDKNSTDRKEQLWSFVSPVSNPASVGTPIASLKRTISGASLGSTTSTTSTHAEETCLDEHAHSKLNNFPDTAFFLKSESTGHFIGVETSSVNSAGGKLSLEPLRKNNFESQLWIFDAVTNRLVNKNSGFFLSAENLSEDSSICQSADSSDQGFKLQAWSLSDEGEIRLKHDENWVLGFKQDSWFGLNREGANVLLQKKASDSKQRKNQRFVIVLPIFKKTTSEIVTVSEQIGLFPDGFFFIKNQKQGLVLTVLDSDKLAAEVLVTKLDTEHYNRQLWRHKDGFLFNKASKLVLDVKGGCVVSGTELCQYTQKKENNDNQLWGLTPEGYIHSKNHKDIVLAIDGSRVDRSNVFITHKKTPDHQEQRWNFVLPVFKQKSSTVTETTVKKCVCYHHFAEYPSGWFLIRSFVNGSNAADSPLVLTADSKSNALTLTTVDKSRWRNQLWMYWHGVLINFQTQLAISANDANIGSFIHQDTRQANSINQRWNLTTDGFLIHGSNPSFALVPEATNSAATKYRLVIDDHITSQKEHRFGLLTPRIVVKDDVQTLESWTVTLLTEWKRFNEQSVQKVVHRVANWPEQPFFIGAHDGLALAPEKSEAFAFVVLKKMASGQSEHFKWVFRDGFLVHCATGLVLHASDNLVGGSQLQIREKLVVENDSIDQRQRWLVKTDGTIVSELKNDLGFALLQQGASYLVQLAYVSNTGTHYNWDFMHGHYESRYSEIYKKQVDVIVRTEKILLTVRSRKAASSSAKLVTQTVGVFPSDWFYIRSKANSSLVLTSPNGDKGTKLTVSKIDYKSFRQQLWHYVDDGCLVNLASDYVIDVAGGALNEGSSLIQWSEKYLKRNRQNQLWTFSVDGHLHPQSRPGLVIGVKGGKVFDGAELQLVTRGSLDLEYQLWSFATPVFGRNGPGSISISSTGDFKNDTEIFVSTVNETDVETSSYETYERTSEVTVVRRWGIFPEGGFFIRINYGDEKLALTVQKKPRVGEKGQTEHEVSLQPLDYKDYLWQFWAYRDGHLINAKTGLALDASITKGLLVEDGLRTLLFVREKSMSVSQFWSLTVDGEIHLRSDQHLVVGISNSRRASVPGAQVGLRELRVKKFVNDKGQRETTLKSEKWLRWVFSKPVYAKSSGSTTTTSKTTTTTTNTTESNVDFVVSGAVLESVSEETLVVTEKEEAGDDYLLDSDSDSDSDDDSSISSKSSSQSSTSVLDKLAIATAGSAAIATAGAGILNSITASSPEQTSATVITDEKGNTQTIQKKTSYKSLKNDRKESFHLSIDYVPTGFEKVVRYKTHQKFNFPSAGYFLIKSYLHGYVLDVVETVKEGAKVVIAPMKVTDYASQLWSFQNGRLVNLKSKNLVLDASLSHKVSSGEKLVLSTQNKENNNSDQHWEFGAEGGLIYLKGKRNLVLTIKDLKIASGTTSVDLFIQEEKSHLKDTHARPEQRWEIKVPSLIPIEQTNSTALDIGYTVIEAGKISVISSSISAIIAFKWLKETFCHKVTTDNQWPSSENWFFIRVGNENAYLASGERDSEAIQFVKLGENEDHKRFLWVYIDGYLVNYKHMLRLTYDKTSNKLLLSSGQETIDHVFTISSSGQLSVNINSQTTYFNVTRRTEVFEIVTSTEKITETSETSVQLHIPVYSDHEVENSSKIAIAAASSWVQSTQKKSSTIQTAITQHHGLFPTATWFFVKVATTGTDSLVLTVKEASTESGATLVLKKLNFKDYKSQLWTFRDNLLINYGSKLVIDVEGNITHSSKIVQSTEAGSSSQKWALTAEGQIHLDSYSNLAFGYESETLQEDTTIVLVSRKETENTKLINWRFSVPVFGKATLKKATVTSISSVTTTVASSIERISECIEQGAIIESVEEADIKVVDNFVKKNTTIAKVESGSSTSTQKSHGFQEILKDVGIAVTAGALGAAVIGTVSKVADKISEQKTSKEQTTVVSQEKKEEAASTTTSTTTTAATTTSGKNSGTVVQNTSGSAVTDQNKKTETIIVRKSQKTSVEVIEESRVIIHAWKIVFTQRVHQCKTKSELIQTIKESREELFRRLDEHLRVHASVDQLISGSVPTWHLSIQQVKEIYRARVFDKFLEHLKSQEVSTVTDIDFEKVVSSVTEEVDSHYQLIIQEQEKTTSESSKVTQEVSKKSESTVHENVIVTIDTIKVTVRYWLIELYEAISVAQKKGSSVEEINTLVESSHKKLLTRLEEIKSSVSTHLESSSSSVLVSKKSSINQSVEAAIKLTETTIASHVSTMVSKKQYTYTEESWQNTVRITEEHLSEKLNVYQTAITQEISEVQKSEIDQTQKAEISVVLDEKMVSVAQKTVTEKLVETQTRLSSWFTEISQQITLCLEQGSEQNIKKDTLALVEASQIEVSTRIEETKLVLRAYYANLTYLSWAERRRIEYSLDNIKASIVANINQFKKRIESSTVSKEDIIRYTKYSFGASVSRIALTEVQKIVTTVTQVSEVVAVKKDTEVIEEETKKVSTDVSQTTGSATKATETIEISGSQTEASSSKATTAVIAEKEKVSKVTKVSSDVVESEVEQTKVSEKKETVTKPSSSSGVKTAVIGAAAAAIASVTIAHHYEGKDEKKTATDSTTIAEKPSVSHANVIIGKTSETIHVEEQTKVASTKKEKSESLTLVYTDIQTTYHAWFSNLTERVTECAKNKGSQSEIETIIANAQEELVISIEKAKRSTTTIIGTSQTSFHKTLSWLRTTAWSQTNELKQIGVQISSSSQTKTEELEEKINVLKKTTFERVDSAIEQCKTSASVIHSVGHASSADISVGKKYEGVDYTKTSHAAVVEKSKVSVGIAIEETRVTIQNIFSEMSASITERRKQGGENVETDISNIVKESRSKIETFVQKAKSSFEEKIKVTCQESEKDEVSKKTQIELVEETNKKLQLSLDKVQESVLVQVSKVEELTVTGSTTVTTETEVTEKLQKITQETTEKVNTTLEVSETVIGHHIEVVAESQHTSVSQEKTQETHSKLTLGAEYGLVVVSETTKAVSSKITDLVETITHRVSSGTETVEQDVKGYISVSEQELDRLCDEAKKKVSYELSMVSSHEKSEEEHFIAAIEEIRVSAKTRISQIKTTTITHKEEAKTLSEKLVQIAEESRHDVRVQYESTKQAVITSTDKVAEKIQGGLSKVKTSTQEVIQKNEDKKEDNQSKVDLAKKVLAASAAVAAGTAIAVEIAKKVSEHKQEVKKNEEIQKQTVIETEEVKVQFDKWISSLTETVVSQTKKSEVSTVEITETIEKSKVEFIEMMKKTKSSSVFTEKHQIEVFSWIEETATYQASRIQEIAVNSTKSSVVDVESALQVIKLSTVQEVHSALEHVKKTKENAVKFIGVTTDQLKQKESALLDIKSELVLVTQYVRTSLVTFFKTFTKTAIERIEAGGENVEKDIAILIAETRKKLETYTEEVKQTATKRLSALETKSAATVISVAALSGIATAEIIHVIKSSEELISQKINRVHSSVWYIEKNQSTTKIVETITNIETETSTEITEKVECTKHTFAESIYEHHASGHITVDKTHDVSGKESHTSTESLQVSLTVQEIKVTIREWLRDLAEKVSVCAQHGGSSEEIDAIITTENKRIFEYLEISVTKISETHKSEEKLSCIHSTMEKVKSSITSTLSEVKTIGIEASKNTHSYGGFDQMTTVITKNEHQISEVLVTCETTITGVTTTVGQKNQTVEETKVSEKQKVSTKSTFVIEYLLLSIRTIMEELMIEVSECSKREHNITIVTQEVNTIVSEFKEYISVEFNSIIQKVKSSKKSSSVIQETISLIEWTRGMILQSSSQVQSIGINAGVSFNSTGGYGQMRPLVDATITQIEVALGRCDKTLKIEVETTNVHYEKWKSQKECRKQKYEAACSKKTTTAVSKDSKQTKESKVTKQKKTSSSSDSCSSSSESESGSESECEQKTKKKVSSKKEKKEQRKQSSKIFDSCSESDSEDEKDAKKKKKKASTGVAIGVAAGVASGIAAVVASGDKKKDTQSTQVITKTSDVKVIVSEWYEQLITEVSKRAKKGGSSASTDIEIIVQKYTKSITETLNAASTNAHLHVANVSTVQQYRASIEWVKNLVIQSSYQVKMIGIQSAVSANSKTGGIEQMRPIATSIQQQVNVEISHYEFVTQTQQTQVISKTEHKKNTDTVCSGRQSAVARKEYCEKLEQHVSEVVAESKVIITAWFAQLVRDISICVHTKDTNVNEEVTKLIEKAKLELNETITRTHSKLVFVKEYENDETVQKIESHVKESLNSVSTLVNTRLQEIQKVTSSKSETEITEKLTSISQTTKSEITETLEVGYKHSVSTIQTEKVQTESTVVVVDTVEEVKTVVASWHTKLSEQIHAISIDEKITNKEEKIALLVKQATTEINRVTAEAKKKITNSSNSIKTVSKTKEEELLKTIDYVNETFTTDVKKIQQVSVEEIKKTNTNVKEKVDTIVKTSGEKINHAVTGTAAVVVGAATAAIAIHEINKHKDEKKQEQEKVSTHGEWSVDVQENVQVMSEWFKLFTKKVSGSITKKSENVEENITTVVKQAEQEIDVMISNARTEFIKRLSHESLDQESYNYACKQYEQSLETVKVSIVTEIYEVKKVAIESHKSGSIEVLETRLDEIASTSTERIKTAMGSAVVISQKAKSETEKNTGGSAIQIHVEDENAIVVGEQDIDFERKEENTEVLLEKKKEKVEEKQSSFGSKFIAGSLAIGSSAAALIYKKNGKEKKEEQKKYETILTDVVIKQDTGVETVESVNTFISNWFTSLIQHVSKASKSGASAQEITSIVEIHRTKLTEVIEVVKKKGTTYCATSTDKQEYLSKIDWAVSVASNQAIQIQQIGINASTSKTDLSSQMQALVTASHHQIEVTLEQLKSTVKFEKKVTEVTETGETVHAGPVCGKMTTEVDKTKTAYTIIQETRVTTIAMFAELSEKIVARIKQGGENVHEDITKMVETTESQVTKVFEEAKSTASSTSEKVSQLDKKTRLEVEEALTSVHKTVQEQITEVKKVSVEVVTSTTTSSEEACKKIVSVSESSKQKIEYGFVAVATAITASLAVAVNTAKKATDTVQEWYSSLRSKIDTLLEASDCTEEEKKQKISVVISEAEVEMNTKITKLQEQTVTTTTTEKTEATQHVSTDHHLDVFFGNIKYSAQSQLEAIKTAVNQSSSTQQVSTTLQKSEAQLSQEVKTHYEAVEKVTSVEKKQEEKSRYDNYKDSIEKVALGSAAVAAAAALAISYHKNNQQKKATVVETVQKTSVQEVQSKVDNWFSSLTQKITACTSKGGENTTAEVNKIVEEAQAELEVTISKTKTQYTSTTTTTSTTTVTEESHRSFVDTLDWIKATAVAQATQITQIVSHGSTSAIDLKTQIENHVAVAKQQIDSALEVHCEKTKVDTIESEVKNTKVTEVVTEKKKTEEIKKVEVVTETREQTKERVRLEMTVVVQESKVKINNWLILLLENITTIVHGNSETIRKDILTRLETAEKELDVFIPEIKNKFLSTNKTSATSQVDTETHTLVVNSQKQTLDCVDSIRSTLLIQISVLREVITRIEVEDIEVIIQQVESIIERTKQRVEHTLEHSVEVSISAAFEGKVVTWSEASTIPESFKNVNTFAFDVVGTVVNYHKTLQNVWKQIISTKKEEILHEIKFNCFIEEWYESFTDIKKKKKGMSDDLLLHEALIRVLKRYYIKDSLTDFEVEQLCDAWRKIDTYSDAQIGIRRIKSQLSGKYTTVAISDRFNARTMVDLAKNNHLCWHSQFSADMFASGGGSQTESESVISGTIRLLGLENASQLAIVSSSPEMIVAARKQGCQSILVEREEETKVEYDVKVGGLDILGESIQSYVEHESMVQTWSQKEAPQPPRVLIQHLKYAA